MYDHPTWANYKITNSFYNPGNAETWSIHVYGSFCKSILFRLMLMVHYSQTLSCRYKWVCPESSCSVPSDVNTAGHMNVSVSAGYVWRRQKDVQKVRHSRQSHLSQGVSNSMSVMMGSVLPKHPLAEKDWKLWNTVVSSGQYILSFLLSTFLLKSRKLKAGLRVALQTVFSSLHIACLWHASHCTRCGDIRGKKLPDISSSH